MVLVAMLPSPDQRRLKSLGFSLFIRNRVCDENRQPEKEKGGRESPVSPQIIKGEVSEKELRSYEFLGTTGKKMIMSRDKRNMIVRLGREREKRGDRFHPKYSRERV